MNHIHLAPTRRDFVMGAVKTAAGLALPAFLNVRGAFAEALAPLAAQTEGPFYPDQLPLDTDNDLIIVNDNLTPAVGEITHLSGKLLDANGNPFEMRWSKSGRSTATASTCTRATSTRQARRQLPRLRPVPHRCTGEYYFRTVKPVPYPGRTPHIHFKIKRPGEQRIHHAVLHQGPPQNERDGIYREHPRRQGPRIGARSTSSRSKIRKSASWKPDFDIVLGVTPRKRSSCADFEHTPAGVLMRLRLGTLQLAFPRSA